MTALLVLLVVHLLESNTAALATVGEQDSLPINTSGGETPPIDQDRVSISSPSLSSFGGDGDTTPLMREVDPR